MNDNASRLLLICGVILLVVAGVIWVRTGENVCDGDCSANSNASATATATIEIPQQSTLPSTTESVVVPVTVPQPSETIPSYAQRCTRCVTVFEDVVVDPYYVCQGQAYWVRGKVGYSCEGWQTLYKDPIVHAKVGRNDVGYVHTDENGYFVMRLIATADMYPKTYRVTITSQVDNCRPTSAIAEFVVSSCNKSCGCVVCPCPISCGCYVCPCPKRQDPGPAPGPTPDPEPYCPPNSKGQEPPALPGPTYLGTPGTPSTPSTPSTGGPVNQQDIP